MQAVVGLGGSAGSISGLRAFFSRMPGNSSLAFAVVIHLSPEHESVLAALLQKVVDWALPIAEMPKRLLEYERLQGRVSQTEKN